MGPACPRSTAGCCGKSEQRSPGGAGSPPIREQGVSADTAPSFGAASTPSPRVSRGCATPATRWPATFSVSRRILRERSCPGGLFATALPRRVQQYRCVERLASSGATVTGRLPWVPHHRHHIAPIDGATWSPLCARRRRPRRRHRRRPANVFVDFPTATVEFEGAVVTMRSMFGLAHSPPSAAPCPSVAFCGTHPRRRRGRCFGDDFSSGNRPCR